MNRPFHHDPVMLDEVVVAFDPIPDGTIVDATLGGGGHAEALLRHRPTVAIVGIDRDPAALDAARARLMPFGDRFVAVRSRFDEVGAICRSIANGGSQVSGALFDLGVSSPQLDEPDRGFSFSHDGPIDMRMDTDAPRSAADLINTAPEEELIVLFREHGEDRFAPRIARAIAAARPITSTAALADVVARAVPAAARRKGHPARRVFQAIRVAVNDELEQLPVALDDAIDALVPGGRIAVLSYHSGEDKITKDRLRFAATGGCICPPRLPCVCGAVPTVRLVRAPKMPSAAEIARNPRAEAARFRVAERLAPDVEGTR